VGTPVPTDDLPAGTAVPDDDLPAASGNSATYVPPTMGGGNSWLDVIKGAPQAIASGFNRGVLDVAGIPMDTATNVANLAKAGIGYTDSKLTGQEPPAWTLPSDPADVTGTSAWLNKWAAKPAGGSIVNVTGDPQSYIDQGLNATYEQIGTGALGVAGEPAAAEFSAGKTAAMTPEEVVRANTPAEQSMGAAAASPRLANTSPELRQAIVGAAQRTGGAVNPDALARHIQADTLPVPVALTEGQALQDPMRLSTEQNLRGQQPDLAKRFNQQNGALVQNFQALRDQVGPDVYTTNPVEHGDTLIKAYQDKAATAEADIDAKYQALRDANGGKFPIDVKQLTTNVEQALHQNLLYEHAPTELGQLQSLAKNGNMTFEQFEAMRTNLARTMRSSTDGNERAAAGAIRQQMENLPLSGQTASLKPLADAARSAARTQFQALEADPAYKAAVAGSVSPDRFVQKFVIGAPRDQVAVMKQNLAHDPVAQQTMGVATVDHLRRSAGIDEMGNGNFSQAGFNKQRQALDPKLRTLVGPQVSETLEQLGDVARYTQAQPRGSFVNNSNTFVSQAAEHAKSLAEAAINAKTGGIPVASWARKAATGREGRAYVRKALAPGAGLGELKP
jgi:hypothetical protein